MHMGDRLNARTIQQVTCQWMCKVSVNGTGTCVTCDVAPSHHTDALPTVQQHVAQGTGVLNKTAHH